MPIGRARLVPGVVVLLVLGAGMAVGVGCARSQAPAPAADPRLLDSPAVPAAPVVSSEEATARILAMAPELEPASVQMLVGSMAGGASDAQAVARASLLEATSGFERLSPDELKELGTLFARAYTGLKAPDRARLEGYLQRLRGGDVGVPEEESRARLTFNAAVLSLAPQDRQRLRALYTRAIGTALAAKAEGARRTAEAVPVRVAMAQPPPTTPPVPPAAVVPPSQGLQGMTPWKGRDPENPPPSGASAGSDDGDAADAAKRARAQQYKSSLASAEATVKQAEAELKNAEEHWSFVNGHTNQSFALNEARSRLDSARKWLDQAKRQRDDIEDAARREGIPPGWLR